MHHQLSTFCAFFLHKTNWRHNSIQHHCTYARINVENKCKKRIQSKAIKKKKKKKNCTRKAVEKKQQPSK